VVLVSAPSVRWIEITSGEFAIHTMRGVGVGTARVNSLSFEASVGAVATGAVETGPVTLGAARIQSILITDAIFDFDLTASPSGVAVGALHCATGTAEVGNVTINGSDFTVRLPNNGVAIGAGVATNGIAGTEPSLCRTRG
jgi:hypothetical protein